MANTIPVTQKPVPSSVSKDAYVLGKIVRGEDGVVIC